MAGNVATDRMAAIVINFEVSITGGGRVGFARQDKRGKRCHGVVLGFGRMLMYHVQRIA